MTICPVCFTILSGNSDNIDELEPELCSPECRDAWDDATFGKDEEESNEAD